MTLMNVEFTVSTTKRETFIQGISIPDRTDTWSFMLGYCKRLENENPNDVKVSWEKIPKDNIIILHSTHYDEIDEQVKRNQQFAIVDRKQLDQHIHERVISEQRFWWFVEDGRLNLWCDGIDTSKYDITKESATLLLRRINEL
jgi:hypothetical protein